MSETPFGRVLTAMVTPFDGNGNVNERGVVAVVEHLLSNGSDGIVVAGTTGESPTLSHDEKVRLFQLVKRTVGRRGTVIAGTGGNDTAASVQITREAAEIGVDGSLLVVPPYNRPSQEGLYRHFRAIAEAAPKLPAMLYNVPSRTAQNLEAQTTVRLARDVSNIVAIKEASGNLSQVTEIFATAPSEFAVYSGDDVLTLPMLAVGARGVISVTSHLVGNEIQAMHAAFFSGDFAEAARLNGKTYPIFRACFQSSTPSPAPVKAALNLMGIDVGGLRLPLVEVNEKERGIVRAALADYGLL